jgi:hypothetical protein
MMFAIKVVNEILTLSNKGLYYETFSGNLHRNV